MSHVLAEMLKQIRLNKGFTLREVQDAVNISNAYLSQLENANASSPSPAILYKLASHYEFPYEKLMEAAGYLQPNPKTGADGLPNLHEKLQTALMSAGLTEEEELSVAEFVEFLRSKRG
jgi:transcriptional regulator with XRE-family HTH domain